MPRHSPLRSKLALMAPHSTVPLRIIDTWIQGQLPVTLTLLAIFSLCHFLASALSPQEVLRLKLTRALLVIQAVLGLWVAAGDLAPLPDDHQVMLLFTRLLSVAVSVGLVNALVFGILLRSKVSVPQVLRDVLFLVSLIVASFILASKHGFDLKTIIPTTAVLTAVIGLALQETLGNLIGGLSIQLDSSVRVGDWVQVESPSGAPLSGHVVSIKWRTTTLETNNFDAVIVPNSMLMKGRVTVLGRRGGAPVPVRRWIYFHVDFATPPGEVLSVASAALLNEKIPNVAVEPAPSVILMSLEDSSARYAARYWLHDLSTDDATDSEVRVRLIYALRRAGIEAAIPSQSVFLTETNAEQRAEKQRHEQDERVHAMAKIELFHDLKEQERVSLAKALKSVSFAKHELLTRQGDAAHWLYVIIRGQVSVSVAGENGEAIEVARLGAGSYFGEMGLMTGEPRSATIQALTHVDCYRLDKDSFHSLLVSRDEIAESVAHVLAKRRVELEQVKGELDAVAREHRQREAAHDLLGRIRTFFRGAA